MSEPFSRGGTPIGGQDRISQSSTTINIMGQVEYTRRDLGFACKHVEHNCLTHITTSRSHKHVMCRQLHSKLHRHHSQACMHGLQHQARTEFGRSSKSITSRKQNNTATISHHVQLVACTTFRTLGPSDTCSTVSTCSRPFGRQSDQPCTSPKRVQTRRGRATLG